MNRWLLLFLFAGGVVGACTAKQGSSEDDDGSSSSSGGSSSTGSGQGGSVVPACHGVGFAPDAGAWTLPDYGVDASGDDVFELVGDTLSCPAGGTLRFQLLDLDGDSRADLLVSDNCDADPATGANQWRLHANTGSGFAAQPTPWALPSYGVDASGDDVFELVSDTLSCPAGGTLRFQVLDMDGDRKPDLLVSDNCDADPATGANQWRVHANTGNGFAAEPTSWALPDYGVDASGDDVFELIGDTLSCPAGGTLRFQLLDMDGDRKPDLVVSDNCDADPATGAGQWRVHTNTGSGFAAQPTMWSLPDYGVDASGDDVFELVGDTLSCPAGGTLRFQLLDMEGDGKPDLVVSDNCDADPATGATQWRVHANHGGGFSPDPTPWSLPDYGVDASGDDVFELVGDVLSCPAGGTLRFQVIDLSDDGKPELLVSDNCDGDPATGKTSWRVHDNLGSGFAADPRSWSLPDYGVDASGDDVFEHINDTLSCPAGGTLRFQLVRLSGEGAIDLVVSDNCDADGGTGAAQWRLHPTMCE